VLLLNFKLESSPSIHSRNKKHETSDSYIFFLHFFAAVVATSPATFEDINAANASCFKLVLAFCSTANSSIFESLPVFLASESDTDNAIAR
jgi:hypothetical protein